MTLPDIVCKTCSDYKHVCLGYTESTAHLRSHSDSASRAPPISSLASGNEANQQNSRAVESCSPEPTHPPARYQKQEKSPQGSKDLDLKDGSSRDTSTRTKTEDSQLAGDSPESSRSRHVWRRTLRCFNSTSWYHHADFEFLSRSYLYELQ